MKKYLFISTFLVFWQIQTSFAQNVTINPANTAAIIDAQSTTQGALLPRMSLLQRNAITLSTGLQVYCTNCLPAGPYIYNGSTWMTMFQTAASSAITYTLGQAGQGGIIFWIDESGQHGLAAATADQGASIWFNVNFTNTKAYRSGIFAGETNTNLIILNQGNGTYAATIAAQHSGGGYGDWYLPSKEELNVMYQKRAIIGGFSTTTIYWSSTEVLVENSFASDLAYGINFSNGAIVSPNKGNLNVVRPIRKF